MDIEGDYTPTYTGSTTPMEPAFYEYAGATWHAYTSGYVIIRGTITFHADTRAYNHALDKAQCALSRLRYPPKQPAHGSISRHREKLRKAGIRH